MSRTVKQPYRKSRAFDSSCRCHGGCRWCERNRLHADRKRRAAADAQIAEVMPVRRYHLVALDITESEGYDRIVERLKQKATSPEDAIARVRAQRPDLANYNVLCTDPG